MFSEALWIQQVPSRQWGYCEEITCWDIFWVARLVHTPARHHRAIAKPEKSRFQRAGLGAMDLLKVGAQLGFSFRPAPVLGYILFSSWMVFSVWSNLQVFSRVDLTSCPLIPSLPTCRGSSSGPQGPCFFELFIQGLRSNNTFITLRMQMRPTHMITLKGVTIPINMLSGEPLQVFQIISFEMINSYKL